MATALCPSAAETRKKRRVDAPPTISSSCGDAPPSVRSSSGRSDSKGGSEVVMHRRSSVLVARLDAAQYHVDHPLDVLRRNRLTFGEQTIENRRCHHIRQQAWIRIGG